MIRTLLLLLFFISAVPFSGCKKDPIVVDGNEAPPDNTIETVIKENYVNKLYISLLGRKATTAEFDEGMAVIEKNNFSVADRKELIGAIQGKSEFFDNEFKIACANLVNESDTNEARMWINIFIQSQKSTNKADEKVWLQAEIDRLLPFISVMNNLRNGSITFVDMDKICVNNNLYDQVNMGTHNFVISMFQNFLFRTPSDTALADGMHMIDYNVGKFPSPFLFQQQGYSKNDFISIFFSSDEYFEGRVRAQFKRFLFREPGSEEMGVQTTNYKTSKDFKAVQIYILSTDEYAGIK